MRKRLRINVEVIPLREMRYPSAGDYWLDKDGVWQFRIVEMHNLLYVVLILIHELFEWAGCRVAGIRMEDIDAFDMKFEQDRDKGLHSETEEPGDHKDAPYRAYHRAATRVEKLACRLYGICWEIYDRAVCG